jgi:uncharacterized Tic20 family protein
LILSRRFVTKCGGFLDFEAGIKANNGEDYKYPYSFELVK